MVNDRQLHKPLFIMMYSSTTSYLPVQYREQINDWSNISIVIFYLNTHLITGFKFVLELILLTTIIYSKNNIPFIAKMLNFFYSFLSSSSRLTMKYKIVICDFGLWNSILCFEFFWAQQKCCVNFTHWNKSKNKKLVYCVWNFYGKISSL